MRCNYSWNELSTTKQGPHALDRMSNKVKTLIKAREPKAAAQKSRLKTRQPINEMQYRSSRAFRLLMTSLDVLLNVGKITIH